MFEGGFPFVVSGPRYLSSFLEVTLLNLSETSGPLAQLKQTHVQEEHLELVTGLSCLTTESSPLSLLSQV